MCHRGSLQLSNNHPTSQFSHLQQPFTGSPRHQGATTSRIPRSHPGELEKLRSALCILLWVQSPRAPSSPSKKFLTQRMQYMDSGCLGHEAAFVTYVAKLEDHKQKCKQAGRYPEAHAAAVRLHELRIAEAERRCDDMLERHQAELQEVEQAFEAEKSQLNRMWDLRIKHIELALEEQVCAIQEQHQMKYQAFLAEHERCRPVRPKYSSDLLNKRKIEEYLAKQGEYTRAHVLKEAADCMESTEMVSTMAAFDAEQRPETE